MLGTLGMILGACLPNKLLVRAWGQRELLAINQQVQGVGKAACWCALRAWGRGVLGPVSGGSQTRIQSLLAERLSVQGRGVKVLLVDALSLWNWGPAC